jgi:hypothetical protein
MKPAQNLNDNNKFSRRMSIIDLLSNTNIQDKKTSDQEPVMSEKFRRKHSVLNDVALKYRFELHEIQKISEEVGLGKKNDNLFRRVSLGGRVLDQDIKYGMKLLHEKRATNTNGIISEEDQEEKHLSNRQLDLPILNTDKLNFKSDINKYNLAQNGKDRGIFDISDISENSIESDEDFSVLDQEEKLNIKKKIEIKIPIHKKRFSLFCKSNTDDDINEEIKQRKESLDKRKKELGRLNKSPRRVSIFKEQPELIKLNEIPVSNKVNIDEQYEKICFGSGKFELIKNYLINPNEKIINKTIIPHSEVERSEISPRTKFLINIENQNSEKENQENTNKMNTITILSNENLKCAGNNTTLENCEISNRNKKSCILNSSYNTNSRSPNLSYRFSLKDIFQFDNNKKKINASKTKKEEGFKMALIRSKKGEIIYTMVRNKNENDKTRRNAVQNMDQRTTAKVDKAIGKLPLASESQKLDLEHKELQKIKDLNFKRIENFKHQKNVNFSLEVEKNKQKLKTIGEKMNKILFDASKIYDKIEKKIKKNIEKKYNGVVEYAL